MVKKIIIRIILALIALALIYYVSLVILFNVHIKLDYKEQKDAFQNLLKSTEVGVAESELVNFDIETSELRLNEICLLATHNSFKKMPPMYISKPASWILGDEVKNNWYSTQPFTTQLNNGYRGLEIDICCYGDGFLVIHDPYKDWRTHSPDFELALKEIKMWSDRNPDHIPIHLMLQLRNQIGVYTPKFKKMNIEKLRQMDKLIEDIFGENVIKPNQVKGEYDTLRDAAQAQAWPKLKDSLGKVFFTILADEKEIELNYVQIDPTFSTQQAFFFMKPKDEPTTYSVFVLADTPFEKGLSDLIEQGYILRTRIDEENNHSRERFEAAIKLGPTILATDYPTGHSYKDSYVCRLTEDEKTVVARGSVDFE